jgi:hypothetical protein
MTRDIERELPFDCRFERVVHVSLSFDSHVALLMQRDTLFQLLSFVTETQHKEKEEITREVSLLRVIKQN